MFYHEKLRELRSKPQKKTKRPQITCSGAKPSFDQNCPLNCSQRFSVEQENAEEDRNSPLHPLPSFSFALLCDLCTFALNRRRRQSGECAPFRCCVRIELVLSERMTPETGPVWRPPDVNLRKSEQFFRLYTARG